MRTPVQHGMAARSLQEESEYLHLPLEKQRYACMAREQGTWFSTASDDAQPAQSQLAPPCICTRLPCTYALYHYRHLLVMRLLLEWQMGGISLSDEERLRCLAGTCCSWALACVQKAATVAPCTHVHARRPGPRLHTRTRSPLAHWIPQACQRHAASTQGWQRRAWRSRRLQLYGVGH